MTDIPFSLEEFDILYRKCLPSLRGIVSKTKGEYTLEDLKGELYVTAAGLLMEGKYDSIFNPDFQKEIPGYLHNHLHKWADKNVRYAYRFDDVGNDEERDKSHWLDGVTASSENDPFEQLCKHDEVQMQENRVNASYSEAVAYFRLFENFWPTPRAIAKHLALTWEWVLHRVRQACKRVQQQCSLFNADGNIVEVIDDDFVPPPSKLQPIKALSRKDRANLKHQNRLRQKKLFPMAYVPIRAVDC